MHKKGEKFLFDWIKQISATPTLAIDTFDLNQMWETNDSYIWKPARVERLPTFFPVYKFEEYYSYNPLPLLLFKGVLKLDPVFLKTFKYNANYQSGTRTIDAEISRVGRRIVNRPTIKTKGEFLRLLVAAMISDMEAVTSKCPDYDHIVLCGGKDSLNILLLPWPKSVVIASSRPNYDLVCKFVEINKLNVRKVYELKNEESNFEEAEVLANFCLNNLEHCRWINDLLSLAHEYPQSIFWKGQLGDTFLTPKWKTYRYSKDSQFIKSLKTSSRKEKDYFKALWTRGAMWQGSHMSQLRLLTGRNFRSVYHGQKVSEVLEMVDLSKCVQVDVRADLGRLLAGREVYYPENNPSPQKLSRAYGTSTPEKFLSIFQGLQLSGKKMPKTVSLTSDRLFQANDNYTLTSPPYSPLPSTPSSSPSS